MRKAKREETITEKWRRHTAFNEKASTIFMWFMLAVGSVVILHIIYLLWQKSRLAGLGG